MGYNAWENMFLRDRFLKMAGIEEDSSFKVLARNLPMPTTYSEASNVDNSGSNSGSGDGFSGSGVGFSNRKGNGVGTEKPVILILTRSPGKYTQNKAQTISRMWPEDSVPVLVSALRKHFPTHEVEVFSDTNSTLMTCPLCQTRAFHRADIAIGFHGAGLTNSIFMRPGGAII